MKPPGVRRKHIRATVGIADPRRQHLSKTYQKAVCQKAQYHPSKQQNEDYQPVASGKKHKRGLRMLEFRDSHPKNKLPAKNLRALLGHYGPNVQMELDIRSQGYQ